MQKNINIFINVKYFVLTTQPDGAVFLYLLSNYVVVTGKGLLNLLCGIGTGIVYYCLLIAGVWL